MRSPSVRARATTGPTRCATCHGGLQPSTAPWSCEGCGAAMHADCAAELGRCATRGCKETVRLPWQKTARVRRVVDAVLTHAVWAVPGLAGLLWPVTFAATFLLALELLDLPAWRASGNDWPPVWAGLAAALLPLALGNGVLAPAARARELPGWHQVRALVSALVGGALGWAWLWVVALAVSGV